MPPSSPPSFEHWRRSPAPPSQWLERLSLAGGAFAGGHCRAVLFVGEFSYRLGEKLQHFAGQEGMNFVLFDVAIAAGGMKGAKWERFKTKARQGGFGPEKSTLAALRGFYAGGSEAWMTESTAQLVELIESASAAEGHKLMPVIVLTPKELEQVPDPVRDRCSLIACDNGPLPAPPPPTPLADVDF